jgi:hypothetical protein
LREIEEIEVREGGARADEKGEEGWKGEGDSLGRMRDWRAEEIKKRNGGDGRKGGDVTSEAWGDGRVRR